MKRSGSYYHLARTVCYLIPVVSLYTVILSIPALIAGVVDRSGRVAYWFARIWGLAILVTTRVRVQVQGLEHLVPGTTYVFVANHQSFFDIPVIFWWIPFQLRITAKHTLGRVPFLGWYLFMAGHLLVNRRNPDRSGILSQWQRLLRQGLSLIIFPEGTRSEDGRVGRFKGGSFLLAVEHHYPVVPISIVGTRRVMRKGSVIARPGDVLMVVHPPIETDTGEWSADLESARSLATRARGIIAAGVLAHETGGDAC